MSFGQTRRKLSPLHNRLPKKYSDEQLQQLILEHKDEAQQLSAQRSELLQENYKLKRQKRQQSTPQVPTSTKTGKSKIIILQKQIKRLEERNQDLEDENREYKGVRIQIKKSKNGSQNNIEQHQPKTSHRNFSNSSNPSAKARNNHSISSVAARTQSRNQTRDKRNSSKISSNDNNEELKDLYEKQQQEIQSLKEQISKASETPITAAYKALIDQANKLQNHWNTTEEINKDNQEAIQNAGESRREIENELSIRQQTVDKLQKEMDEINLIKALEDKQRAEIYNQISENQYLHGLLKAERTRIQTELVYIKSSKPQPSLDEKESHINSNLRLEIKEHEQLKYKALELEQEIFRLRNSMLLFN